MRLSTALAPKPCSPSQETVTWCCREDKLCRGFRSSAAHGDTGRDLTYNISNEVREQVSLSPKPDAFIPGGNASHRNTLEL